MKIRLRWTRRTDVRVPSRRGTWRSPQSVSRPRGCSSSLRARGVDVDAEIARKGTRRSGLVSIEVIVEDPVPPQFFSAACIDSITFQLMERSWQPAKRSHRQPNWQGRARFVFRTRAKNIDERATCCWSRKSNLDATSNEWRHNDANCRRAGK